ncbi:hypothetical protein A9320_27430 [Ruegeria sp. PBVC088]|nr:hypothetical protein A9320_27430 [Ruegeria sp. PBVC088]
MVLLQPEDSELIFPLILGAHTLATMLYGMTILNTGRPVIWGRLADPIWAWVNPSLMEWIAATTVKTPTIVAATIVRVAGPTKPVSAVVKILLRQTVIQGPVRAVVLKGPIRERATTMTAVVNTIRMAITMVLLTILRMAGLSPACPPFSISAAMVLN